MLHLDASPLAPQGKASLESLAIDACLDELHRHSQVLDFEISVLVVEEQLCCQHGHARSRTHHLLVRDARLAMNLSEVSKLGPYMIRTLEVIEDRLPLTRVDFQLMSAQGFSVDIRY